MNTSAAPLAFLIGRLVRGRLRDIRRHKSQIIFIVIVVALFVLMMVVTAKDTGSSHGWVDVPLRGSILTAICLVFTYLAIRNGLDKGSTFFRSADVNLVFPSPLSPRAVLVYGFARQLGISLLVLLWLALQTVNLKGLFDIQGFGFVPFYIGAFLIVCYMPVTAMLIYRYVQRRPAAKPILRRTLLVVVIAILALLVAGMALKSDPLEAVRLVLNHRVIGYLPVFGWIHTLMATSYLGWSPYAVASLGLALSTLTLLVFRLLRSDPDYYEDVLLVTTSKETAIRQKRQGRSPFSRHTGRVRRVRPFYRGYGASALFYRQLLEYRKVGILIFDKSTLLIGAAGAIAGYLLRDTPLGIYYLLYISIYILFFLSFDSKWDQELLKPFIFALPGGPMAKIWYATLAVHLKHLVEGLLLFGIAGGLYRIPVLSALLLALCFTAFGALYLYVGILFRRWFGRITDMILSRVLMFMLVLVFISPATTAIVVASVRFAGVPATQWLLMAGAIVYSTLIALGAMGLGRRLFSEMETAGR